jgi:RNA-directed DNA polymerase
MRENREAPAAPAGSETAGRRENAMSDESFMHAAGESHDCVVPAKAPNKDPQGSAEGLEGRRSIKENTGEANPSRTQSREIGSRGLCGVREAAKRDKGLHPYPWSGFAPNIQDKNRVR